MKYRTTLSRPKIRYYVLSIELPSTETPSIKSLRRNARSMFTHTDCAVDHGLNCRFEYALDSGPPSHDWECDYKYVFCKQFSVGEPAFIYLGNKRMKSGDPEAIRISIPDLISNEDYASIDFMRELARWINGGRRWETNQVKIIELEISMQMRGVGLDEVDVLHAEAAAAKMRMVKSVKGRVKGLEFGDLIEDSKFPLDCNDRIVEAKGYWSQDRALSLKNIAGGEHSFPGIAATYVVPRPASIAELCAVNPFGPLSITQKDFSVLRQCWMRGAQITLGNEYWTLLHRA